MLCIDYINNLDNQLKSFLQKTIKFNINNKTYKEGQLINYNFTYYGIFFNIRGRKKEIVKVPIPFDFEYHDEDELLYFDYRIKTFSNNDIEVENYLENIKKQKVSKYYNKILEIGV